MKLLQHTLVSLAVAAALGAGAAQAQVSDNVIKIGVLSDMSSLYTDLAGAGSVIAAKMAVEDSGIEKRGYKVEIVSADHQNKPDVGSAVARQWYDQDKVDVIVDTPNSGVALAVSQITKDKGKAFLASGPGTSDLSGKACSPNTIHWAYDTWMLANGTGTAITKGGGDTWFFITADYAFGAALERDTSAAVTKNGGKVVGGVKAPLNSQDFSSFLLQAQASKAKVIGLANAGGDTTNSIKQAATRVTKGGRNWRARSSDDSLAADRAGAYVHGDFLLGHERPDARLLQALLGAGQGHPSDDGARGRVLVAPALLQGRRSAQERRRHEGHREDEGDADRRSAVRQGLGPRRRPQDPSRLPGPGEDAGGIEVSVGLLQGRRDDSGGSGIPAVGPRRLRVGEKITTRRSPASPRPRGRGRPAGAERAPPWTSSASRPRRCSDSC
jgi:ABC-type branched-subunit amino acid transport system substrate-binding protein